jgi:lipoyl(octanoyl) transferase
VKRLAVLELGLLPYAQAWTLQRELATARADGHIEDVLLLLQHPPTLTHSYTGRGSGNVLATPEQLQAAGVALEPTDRGGDVTAHEPGQLVGYPIVQLADRDLHAHLRRIEAGLIELAAAFGVATVRVPGRTGTWLPDGSAKLAAIGVKVGRWVTTHGFALNVDNDLSTFELIVPCGITDAGVTSLRRVLGEAAPSLGQATAAAGPVLARAFGSTALPPSRPLSMLLRRVAPAFPPPLESA